MSVTYKNVSLFDAPRDSIIVHACNSQGMWGSGIAKPFKEKYPYAYNDYRNFCSQYNDRRGTACGLGTLSTHHVDENHWVGWIVTSHNYGPLKDSPDLIKINTTLALKEFCQQVYALHPNYTANEHIINIYSNKFNSGLFAVPWEDSELILNTVLRDFNRINWTVCDPESK